MRKPTDNSIQAVARRTSRAGDDAWVAATHARNAAAGRRDPADAPAWGLARAAEDAARAAWAAAVATVDATDEAAAADACRAAAREARRAARAAR